MHSLRSSEFKDAVQKNEQLYSKNRGEEVEVYPEFAKLFLESKTLSSNFIIRIRIGCRERFSQLLKPSKRDREIEIEESKDSADVDKLKKLNKDKEDLINDLKRKIWSFENEKLEYLDDRSKFVGFSIWDLR